MTGPSEKELADGRRSRFYPARRMAESTVAGPQARWDEKEPSSRIHSIMQEARRHQRRGDTTVDLGCPSDTMIQGFRVAGLLSLLDCRGACPEFPEAPRGASWSGLPITTAARNACTLARRYGDKVFLSTMAKAGARDFARKGVPACP